MEHQYYCSYFVFMAKSIDDMGLFFQFYVLSDMTFRPYFFKNFPGRFAPLTPHRGSAPALAASKVRGF